MQHSPGAIQGHQQPLREAQQHDASGHARTLPSTDLLQGGRSVEISHNGSVYRLQTTKLGKLILTK
jgi:hemin uptake protein HemP